MIFQAENVHTGQTTLLAFPDRKSAHEAACTLWPGVPVEITTVRESEDREVVTRGSNRIYEYMDSVLLYLADDNYYGVNWALDGIQAELCTLQHHFSCREGEDHGDSGNPNR